MIRALFKLLSVLSLFAAASRGPGALAKNRAWVTIAHPAFVLAGLAFTGRAGAITESEQIAFAGVDTLQVYVTGYRRGSCIGEDTAHQSRACPSHVWRSCASAPTPRDVGPWLEIHTVAMEQRYKGGGGTGNWAFAVLIQLREIVPVSRGGQSWHISVSTWKSSLVVGYGPKMEAREMLLDHIAETAEEVSNLYLAAQ